MADRQQTQPNRPVSDEMILKTTKEIVVKFIEVGRVTPASFDETFLQVFDTIKKRVKS